jgi:hypothetical protein
MNDIVLIERFELDVRDALRRKPFKRGFWHDEIPAPQCDDSGSLHQTLDRL